MKKLDFIIVGGGLAGSLLALELIQMGKQVILYSDPMEPGSSSIAAGMINPITGRKFVKSWKIDTLIEQAKTTYGKLENTYGRSLLTPLKIIRGIKSIAMLNDWSARLSDGQYRNYVDGAIETKRPYGIKDSYTDFATITGAYRVDFDALMALAEAVLMNQDALRKERFDYGMLTQNGSISYQDISSKYIVFTEGSAVKNNPFWNGLPFVPAKGERFIIHAPDLKMEHAFTDNKIIIPVHKDHYWVGSNYEWKDLEPVKTEAGFALLKAHLDDVLEVDYKVVNHAAHIRPASYNRRPFVGRHPDFSNCFILNGLGAKGGSLAPYCIDQLLNYVLKGADLDVEIDVGRVRLRQGFDG